MEPVENPIKTLLLNIQDQALHDYIVLCARGYIRDGEQVKRIEGESVIGMDSNLFIADLLDYMHNGDYERVAQLTGGFDDVPTILRRAEIFAQTHGPKAERVLEASKQKASRPRPRILQEAEDFSRQEPLVCGIPNTAKHPSPP